MAQKLAILNTHPIQYFAHSIAGWLRNRSGLDRLFLQPPGSDEYIDEGFGQRLKWDIPLLDGYKHVFLKNLRRRIEWVDFGA